MTSGSKFVGHNAYDAYSPSGTFGFRKNWDGGDGRHTVFAGQAVDQWNPYSMSLARRSTQRSGFDLEVTTGLPPFAGPPITTIEHVDTGFDTSVGVSWSDGDQLRLLSKLSEKVRGHDFNLAVSTAQGRQLTVMASEAIIKFSRALRSLKRGDFATAARQFGSERSTSRSRRLKTTDVSGRWLELQYGWLPTLRDVHEAAKAYEALTSRPRLFEVRVKHFVAKTGLEGSQSPSIYHAGFSDKVTKYLRYQALEQMEAPRSLGLLDPLSVVWEIIPYSFVFDWFLPIGAYLENLSQIPFLKGRFLTTTVRKQEGFYDIQYIPQPPIPGTSVAVAGSMPSVSYLYLEMQRVPSDALQVPFPTFSWDKAISGTRIYNAVALAHQLLLRR